MKENQTYDQKSLKSVSGSKADFDEIAKDCVAFANREGGYLTNLGVLWLGTQPQRARLLYSPTVQFIRYDAEGNKVFKQVWDDYALGLLLRR